MRGKKEGASLHQILTLCYKKEKGTLRKNHDRHCGMHGNFM
jgi:hypothetical protein